MKEDGIIIQAKVVNRARILKGWGRMRFYEAARCDPRTGCKALNAEPVHILVVTRFAKALGLRVSDIIDLEKSGLAEETSTERVNGSTLEGEGATCVA